MDQTEQGTRHYAASICHIVRHAVAAAGLAPTIAGAKALAHGALGAADGVRPLTRHSRHRHRRGRRIRVAICHALARTKN